MTDLVLVRHGETVWHAGNRYTGSSDVPLTFRGKKQAEQLAGWAATAGLGACFCSPLTRARETLRPAARAAGLTPRYDARLVELDFGDGEGLTAAEMAERFPEHLAAFRRDPVACHLPAGEDPNAAIKRASAFLDEVTTNHPDQRVLIVWHSTLMRLMLCHLLGIRPANYRRVFPIMRNGALTEIRLTPDGCALLQFNAPIGGPPER